MKYLLLLLFLVGCSERPKQVPTVGSVKSECKFTEIEGYSDHRFKFCKITNSAGKSTCMLFPLSQAAAAITCEFYESL